MKKKTDPLRVIPGVGPSIAADLRDLGFTGPGDLAGGDPEKMFEDLNALRGVRQDRCVLYVFRCAVYFAGGGRDGEKLKWWTWKDGPGQVARDLSQEKH